MNIINIINALYVLGNKIKLHRSISALLMSICLSSYVFAWIHLL